MIKSIKIIFISVMFMLIQSVLYANVIIGNGNIERLNDGVIKDINCQNYTINTGGLLDTSNGGTLREVTKFTNNGTWNFGTGNIKELGAWENNGNIYVKPTQMGATANLQFTTLCGPISVLGTSDTDGDGISDADEGDNAVALGHGILLDQDSDGIYNFLDDDSDNDGLSDVIEGGNDVDADSDGIPDYLDNSDSRPNNSNDSSIGNTIGDDVSIDILDNDTLNNGDAVIADDVNVTLIAPEGATENEDGSVTVPGEGTWRYDAATGMLTFSPISGFTGNPTPITYVITEIATGLTSAPATINVAYDAAVMAPVADDDSSTGNTIGEDVSINILDGDKLGSGEVVTPSAIVITLIASENGVLNPDGSITVEGEGVWKYDAVSGMLTFIPQNGFVGIPTVIHYELKEVNTGLIDRAEVTVTYNVKIKAEDDDIIEIKYFGANVVDVLKNDIFDGNVTIHIMEQPIYGTLEVVVESDRRTIILYSPEADINHMQDTFSYSIIDVNGNTSEATVRLDIQCTSSQTSDRGNAFNYTTLIIMMVLTMMIGLYTMRREDDNVNSNE